MSRAQARTPCGVAADRCDLDTGRMTTIRINETREYFVGPEREKLCERPGCTSRAVTTLRNLRKRWGKGDYQYCEMHAHKRMTTGWDRWWWVGV